MTLLLLGLSTVLAVLPMVVFLAIVWWLDRYDREPIWLVALTFAWGALGAVAFSMAIGTSLILFIDGWLSVESTSALYTMLLAPLTEEPMKALVLLLIVRTRHFDNTTDGFVYGAAAGLGFGMTENLLYFASASISSEPLEWCFIVLIRTCFSALMHGTATAIVGAMLGWSRFHTLGRKLTALGVGMTIAIAVHALWNTLISVGPFFTPADTASLLTPLSILLAMGSFALQFALVFALFLACVGAERRDLRRQLAAEAERGTLPQHHVAILSNYWRRNQSGWLPLGTDHDLYVQSATTLAFRRKQASLDPSGPELYSQEIQRLRTILLEALEE